MRKLLFLFAALAVTDARTNLATNLLYKPVYIAGQLYLIAQHKNEAKVEKYCALLAHKHPTWPKSKICMDKDVQPGTRTIQWGDSC